LNGFVCETNYPKPGRNQQCLALGIVLLLLVMHFAVKLNRKAPFDAEEVDDERADGMLPPELQASQTAPAQRFPQKILGVGFASP